MECFGGKEVGSVTGKELDEIADEIVELLKEKNLTVKIAWRVISTVREKLHEKAYNTKIN